jgi:4-hydroxy-2-oxoheptanedioate aldolase
MRTQRMVRHPVRKVWDEGRVALTSWCSIPSPYTAEALALLDYDCMVIDMQHGMIDFSDMVRMLQGIEASGLSAMVRLPWNDVGLAQKVLDAGASGLICPMVNNREECARFVGACQYPPLGYRSFGGLRSSSYYDEIGEVFTQSREAILVFAMIETVEAMKNAEAIASVPGLDGIFFGPADLSASAGRAPAVGVNDGFIDEAHRTIIDLCRRHGLKAGINAMSPQAAASLAETGYEFIPLHSDLGLLRELATATLRETRAALGGARRSQA